MIMIEKTDVDLNLFKDEKVIERFHSIETSSFKSIFFPTMWILIVFITISGVIGSFSIGNYFLFYLTLIFLIGFSIFWGLLYDNILRASNATLIITSNRVIYLHGKGLLRYEKKRKVINIEDISYIQSWPDSIEIVKRRPKGDRYNGAEMNYKVTPMNYYFIALSLTGPEGIAILLSHFKLY